MGKKNKKKGDAYFSEKDFPKEKLQQKVYSNSPEKAAKKLFKMFKRLYSEKGYVKVLSSGDEEWIFNISSWTDNTNRKFSSRNKTSWKDEHRDKITTGRIFE